MKPYKLFIASSMLARNTALFLWSELQNVAKIYQLELEPELWWETSTFSPGENTLDALITKSGAIDFAIVLLTPDDLAEKGEYKQLIPRDNCIYEAGLFTGSLGPDPKRCFLLTACDKMALPTDLLGLTIVRIPHSPPGALSDGAKREIKEAANKVVEQIAKSGPFRRALIPLVPGTDLSELERLGKAKGHLRRNSLVIVRAEQPLELDDPQFAARVQENMRGGVKYQYFFYADQNASNIIAELVQALAAAGIDDQNGDLIEKMEADFEKVVKNLETVAESMAIYLLMHKPSFQMCVHNAEWLSKAKCYVRYPKTGDPEFILWSEGAEAKRLSLGLQRLRKLSAQDKKKSEDEGEDKTKPEDEAAEKPKKKTAPIFRPSMEFDLKERKDYRSSLQEAIEDLFPEKLREKVVKFCFG